MRTLSLPPSAPFALRDGAFEPARDVACGSFAGPLPAIDWTGAAAAARRGPLWRLAHGKRWIYVAVRDGDLLVAAAVVRMGYASTALAWVWDAREEGLLDERVAIGPPSAARVLDVGPGLRSASFEAMGLRICIEPGAVSIDAAPGAARGKGQRAGAARDRSPLHLRARMEAALPPPIGAIGLIPGGLASATQKHLAVADGELLVAGTRRPLRGAIAAFDYTNGMLARQTAWRWALALGRASDGRRLALNLVEGFMGERECALWVGDELLPLGEGRFSLDAHNPLLPWTIRSQCGSVDLTFHPGALHAQHQELMLVRSRFLQPSGRFLGRILAAGLDLGDVDLLGVAEDQDVVW